MLSLSLPPQSSAFQLGALTLISGLRMLDLFGLVLLLSYCCFDNNVIDHCLDLLSPLNGMVNLAFVNKHHIRQSIVLHAVSKVQAMHLKILKYRITVQVYSFLV
jgi:hypothetical protein